VEVGLDEKVPFAAVAFLGAGPAADIKGPLSLKDLCGYLDGTLGEPDIPRIIRIDGTFSHMKTRSVGPGDKRYKGLNEAVKEQAVFEFRNVKGALIGFRFPACAGLVNAPGYHFHFISEDRASGGHVLDMVMEQGTLFAEKKERWEIQFLY
jgi:acetolactate decarboxylase